MAVQVQRALSFGGVLQPPATPKSSGFRSYMMTQPSGGLEGLCRAALPRHRVRGLAAPASSTPAIRVLVAGVVSEALHVCQAQGPHRKKESDSPSNLTPSVIHWILAIILGVALVAGLVHVYRVLQKEDAISPVRRLPPEGMRAVQCGACHAMQHVTVHGRIFICFSCHNANRIAMDISSDQQQELVTASGPLRRFEFKREGENFFQETMRADVEPGSEETANPSSTLVESNAASCEAPESNVPSATNDCTPGNQVQDGPSSTSGDIELGTAPATGEVAPQVVGRTTSDNPSESSRKSRPEWQWGLAPCVVCLDMPGNMVLLPCAHGSVCEECATRIAQNHASGGAHCPHCRANIETLVKITEVEGTVVKAIEHRIPIARTL
mmetsp:Transcript_27984/g.51354  ORF Transcript_27984/g.51354 Transcript_27984/m.51354 type:complete len:382 (+) Transcript_27984:122-1267(+)